MGNVTLQERVKSTKLIKEERELFLEKTKCIIRIKNYILVVFGLQPVKMFQMIFVAKKYLLKTIY